MVFIGDGFSDIPCMKVVKDKGGVSICVYNPDLEKAKNDAEKIISENRVQYIAPADYRENSLLFEILKNTLDKMVIESNLEKLTY
jgi:hypothetical protein